jgi:hypothetical protein
MNTSDNPIGFVECPQNLFSLGLLRCISPHWHFQCANYIEKSLLSDGCILERFQFTDNPRWSDSGFTRSLELMLRL